MTVMKCQGATVQAGPLSCWFLESVVEKNPTSSFVTLNSGGSLSPTAGVPKLCRAEDPQIAFFFQITC